ncbi:hypothetical protein H0H93_003638 [Arthromyces matolae]|nr:hypothetical protein H0H93_003638 [Arthromyces matolae]
MVLTRLTSGAVGSSNFPSTPPAYTPNAQKGTSPVSSTADVPPPSYNDPRNDPRNDPQSIHYQRPSEYWLRNPGWIDGAVNPPRFYYTNDDIDAALIAAGKPPLQHQQDCDPNSIPLFATAPAAAAPSEPTAHNAQESEPRAMPPMVSINSAHLVSVTMFFTPTTVNAPAGRSKNAKKDKKTKMTHIDMDGITRVDFVKAFLTVYELNTHFSPGIHSGPDFKFWFTGIVKTAAATIQNDQDFEVILKALHQKDRKRCQVNVEFDVDTMQGFRIVQPQLASSQQINPEEELVYGTRVPSITSFSADSQIHGQWIKQLKDKWPCASHSGEHGENGFCYIAPNGKHIGLNNRRLKAWAAAILTRMFQAAGDATKSMPPNIPEFDGVRDGSNSTPRPRGRNGPAIATGSTGIDSNLLITAILASLKRGRSRSRSCSPPHAGPSTPKRSRHKVADALLSSPPEPGMELDACLRDFAKAKNIDMTAAAPALQELDLTPDIIPKVPISRLCEVTEAREGRVMKFQQYCETWQTRFEAKLEKKPRSE